MSYRKKHHPSKPDKPVVQDVLSPDYDNPGALRPISTGRLTFGLPYQRPINEREVYRLMREWDDRLFNPPFVSFRDGRFNLVDGQNPNFVERGPGGTGMPEPTHTGVYTDGGKWATLSEIDVGPVHWTKCGDFGTGLFIDRGTCCGSGTQIPILI